MKYLILGLLAINLSLLATPIVAGGRSSFTVVSVPTPTSTYTYPGTKIPCPTGTGTCFAQ